MLYNYSDIKTIHLEITERCNVSCPQCGRNINGGEENQYLNNNELSLIDIEKVIPTELIQQLTHFYMCGNYGDPIVAKDTLDVFNYIRQNNSNILLSMNTNGSARTIEWWQSLAKVFGKNGYVIFSIDGLEDTNHIYRKNTNWTKILENVKAFINAGGIAHWEFIVFKHNEHQVEQAEELSKKLGFEKFQLKKTARFISGLSGVIRNEVKLVDRKGNNFNIEMPTNPKYINSGIKNYSNSQRVETIVLPTTFEEIKDKLNPEVLQLNPNTSLYDKTEIDCKVKKEKSIYISAEGIVQPCCWVASTMYSWYHSPRSTQIWKFINKVGKDKLNAHKHSLREIIEGDYFTNLISDSWTKPSCKDGKLAICAKTCGKDLETFSKQYA